MTQRNCGFPVLPDSFQHEAVSDARDPGLVTLWTACYSGNSETLLSAVKAFNLGPTSLSTPNNKFSGQTPLHYAAARGHLGLVVTLLKLLPPDSVNCVTTDNTTPLLLACYYNRSSVVDSLLEASANPYIHRADGLTVFHAAALAPFSASITRALLSVAQDEDQLHKTINTKNQEGDTPLMVACRTGASTAAMLFLGAGADPAQTDKTGRCCFEIAMLHRRVLSGPFISALCETVSKEKLNMPDKFGNTPLMQACDENHDEIAFAIAQYLPDFTIRNKDGLNALELVCFNDQSPKLVTHLLLQGAECDRSFMVSGPMKRALNCFRKQQWREVYATVPSIPPDIISLVMSFLDDGWKPRKYKRRAAEDFSSKS